MFWRKKAIPTKEKKSRLDIKKLIERIVTSIEVNKKLDTVAYDALTKQFPQTKSIVDELISELRLFSIYDDEPHTVNFEYSAYLEQIEELASNG